jgi:hypothetical protein
LSTTAETEFIEDPNANVNTSVGDPDAATDQHEHDHGQDENGNVLKCADPGCAQKHP